MTAEIIVLPVIYKEHDTGNGAREVVRTYLERVHSARVMARVHADPIDITEALTDHDHFLAWLWQEGFMIVPVSMP